MTTLSVKAQPAPAATGPMGQIGSGQIGSGPQSANPHPPIDPQVAALSQLLRVEAEARQAPTEAALAHLIANETRGLVRARQAFVIRKSSSRSYRVQTVSSLALVDRNTPMIQWIERLMLGLGRDKGTSGIVEFVLPAYADATDTMTTTYPFPNLLWVPL